VSAEAWAAAWRHILKVPLWRGPPPSCRSSSHHQQLRFSLPRAMSAQTPPPPSTSRFLPYVFAGMSAEQRGSETGALDRQCEIEGRNLWEGERRGVACCNRRRQREREAGASAATQPAEGCEGMHDQNGNRAWEVGGRARWRRRPLGTACLGRMWRATAAGRRWGRRGEDGIIDRSTAHAKIWAGPKHQMKSTRREKNLIQPHGLPEAPR
jgi:hypothetical protein